MRFLPSLGGADDSRAFSRSSPGLLATADLVHHNSETNVHHALHLLAKRMSGPIVKRLNLTDDVQKTSEYPQKWTNIESDLSQLP